MFKTGTIHDVIVRDLKRHVDQRGWLTEIFRQDEVDERYLPVMQYISMTHPGVARGPHEHVDQADYFAFIGPSTFRIYLWDNRKASPTHFTKQVIDAGESAPRVVIIPPGVVHGYKNVGGNPGWVINLPNRLYAGRGKKEEVDEIRHEHDPNSIFLID
jgi:dTDP-4-dehydrorhamnose 3,5-epimerase